MKHSQTKQSAFSLVELSIVLVILGLLVGGILAGQSLIRAAEIRSVNVEYQRYATAIGTFRDKYFALPGDFLTATSVWASGTANGDGNGQIMGSAPTTPATNETGHFWAQLALAGLIEGSYTPASWAAINAPTTNPKAKMNPGTWSMRYVAPVGVDDTVIGTTGASTNVAYEGSYGNAFFLMSGTTLLTPSGGVVKSEEAWNIDTKMDDGKPATGSVLTLESQTSSTAGSGCGNTAKSTASQASSGYDLTNASTTACSMVFKSGY